MYFSKGKTQSAQSSMTDLSNPSLPTRPSSAIQKNVFNFNIYFSENNQQSVAQLAAASLQNQNGGTKQEYSTYKPYLMDDKQHISSNMQTVNNNISLHQYQGTSNQNQNHHQHRQLKYSLRDGEQGGARILMQHTAHKFKQLSIPGAVPKQINGQTNKNFEQTQYQQFGLINTNTLKNSSRRSVTRIKLVGYSGDPEFQMIKDTSYKIVQANEGMLVLNMDEIDNEIDYDQKLKQLKRSSSAFLPAYKAFKNNSSHNNVNNIANNNNNILNNNILNSNTNGSTNTNGNTVNNNLAQNNSNGVNNNNNSQTIQGSQLQFNLNTVTSATNAKRPYYFLTEKNEPLFSLKQLQERFPMKYQAQEIIQQHEDHQNLVKNQINRNPSMIGSNEFNSNQNGQFINQVEQSRFNNVQSNPSYSSFSNASSAQSTARGQSQSYVVEDMNDKKHVYLTIRTAQKFFNKEGNTQFFSFFPSDLTQSKSTQQQQNNQNSHSKNGTCNEQFNDINSLQNNNVLNENTNLQNNQQGQNQTSSNLYNNGEPFKIVIELYTKIAPKACENFMKLCEGFINNDGNYLTFRNTQALRIKKNGFIQMGYSKPGVSIYNGYFEDESFAVLHDKPGIIGYCNRGVPHTNSSQFYITLGEMKNFDKKMVAFGRVISGFKHFEKMNKIMLNSNSEIPPFNISIIDSGLFQVRPSTNQSRHSTTSNISSIRTPKRRNEALQFGQNDSDHVLDDTYRVVRPDLFTYKGEKVTKFQSYEQYVIGESEKHKDLAAAEYITLMLTFQTIACICQDIMNNSYSYKSIESIRAAMKNAFVTQLSDCQSVALLYDTKDDEVYIESNHGKFVVAFTSLDVDNLCDLNTCGSLFLIFRKTTTSFRPAKKTDLLQSGESIFGAGYIMYGQSTQIVFHTGNRLNGYTYDPENNLFVLTHPRIKSSKRSGIISCDESQLHHSINDNIHKFIKRKKIAKESYVTRYVGSKVADFHRTLLYGGILIYPQKSVNIFEAFTMSYIIDKAWDRSSCGQDGQILIKKPNEVTDLVQLYIGNSSDVLEIDNLFLSIRRKNSLYKIHDAPSSKALKTSNYSIHKTSTHTQQNS